MLISYVKNLIRDKSVCILGFGREGRSTYSLFTKAGGYKSLTVCDLNPVTDVSPSQNVSVISGADYQKTLNSFDLIMKSPGIVLENGVLSDFSKLSSQTEIFLRVYRDRTVGITGTKGKSTTSSLIYHVLNFSGKSAVLLGNIGIPPFDGIVSEDAVIVFELSSHQLEYTRISPHTAIFLNIFPEHLDHYGTFDKYYAAKKNIFLYQTASDVLIAHTGVDTSAAPSRVTTFGENGAVKIFEHSFSFFGTEISLTDNCPLLGSHNVNNVAAAYAALQPFGITTQMFLSALSTFSPLPHRLEKVGEKDGITYYDDSISTCSQTTIQALLSLNNVGTLLLGGMDRGIDYSPLISFLSSFDIPNVIFMYDSGARILAEFDGVPHLFKAHSAVGLKEAVELAKRITPKGSVCLLSPAAASYGFFKNFEDRGDKFKLFALG